MLNHITEEVIATLKSETELQNLKWSLRTGSVQVNQYGDLTHIPTDIYRCELDNYSVELELINDDAEIWTYWELSIRSTEDNGPLQKDQLLFKDQFNYYECEREDIFSGTEIQRDACLSSSQKLVELIENLLSILFYGDL